MKTIEYKRSTEFSKDDIKSLYEDAGWAAYTKDLPKLMKAIESSLLVISAWDNDKLVGLIRIVGDGLTIIYIQDILVLSTYKRKGIGSELLKQVLNEYLEVRQKVLSTEDSLETKSFYEANGFKSIEKYNCISYVIFN